MQDLSVEYISLCGRKNFPIWEANKNQTKQDNFLKILNNAILKFRKYITQVAALIVDTLSEPLPVLFHDPLAHFGRNGSNFLVIASLRPSKVWERCWYTWALR
jgi:hypothetical protein